MQTVLQMGIVVPAGGGDNLNVLGTLVQCKVSSDETGGAYSVIEATVPPKGGPPAHIHGNEDEIFYVVEGEFEIRCGDQTFNATKGALAVLPRGIPHTFRNTGTRDGKLLTTITPGGFEKFFEDVDREITTIPPDVEKLKAIARRYNAEFQLG